MSFKNSVSTDKGKKGLIFVVLIALVLSGFGLAQDVDPSSLQWTAGLSGKLMKDETLIYKGYSIEAMAFPAPVESQKYRAEPEESVNPFVGLNISKNGSFVGIATLVLGQSYITPDGELKVTAKELPKNNAREWILESYAPWAIIELNPRGTPNLAVSIQTDKDTYTSSPTTDITATVILENRGSADVFDVDMVIETELPIKKGTSKYHYDRIKLGETITETITFQPPILAEHKTFSISANANGYDVKGAPYTAEFLKNIPITSEIPVSLSIHKRTVSKMYLKDYTIISLSIKNTGRYDINNLNISDSLPDGFKLLGTHELHWVIDIPVGGEWDNRYLVRPVEANKEGVELPQVTAEFTFRNEVYTIQSNQPTIVVYGPNIGIKKQTDVSVFNPGDIVTVTVTAENTGSTYTRITIVDTIPDKTTLISGKTTFDDFLEATQKISFDYTLRIDSEDRVLLPAATADYYEIGTKGRRVSTKSNELEIWPESAGIIPTPIPTTPTTPTPTVTVTPEVPTTPGIIIVTPTTIPDEEPVVLEPLNTILKLSGKVKSVLFAEPTEIVSISKNVIDTIHLNEYADVSLSIKNNGEYDLKNVIVTDSIPDGFNLLINQSLRWVIDIPAGEVLEYRYYIKPQQTYTEGIDIPSATAELSVNNEFYSIQSNQPKIAVLGQYDVHIEQEPTGKIPVWVYLFIALIIGVLIYNLKKHKKPIEVNEVVIGVVPDDADRWSNQGFDLYVKGKYGEATKAYDKAKDIIHKGFTEEER